MKNLNEKEFTASLLTTNVTLEEVKQVVSGFKMGNVKTVVTTDYYASTNELKSHPFVINYNLCNEENYIQRIGRFGCFARKGMCINLVTNNDLKLLQKIEKLYNTKIEELPANVSDFL